MVSLKNLIKLCSFCCSLFISIIYIEIIQRWWQYYFFYDLSDFAQIHKSWKLLFEKCFVSWLASFNLTIVRNPLFQKLSKTIRLQVLMAAITSQDYTSDFRFILGVSYKNAFTLKQCHLLAFLFLSSHLIILVFVPIIIFIMFNAFFCCYPQFCLLLCVLL